MLDNNTKFLSLAGIEKSRRLMLAALVLLFVSQFFGYTTAGQTTTWINFNTHLVTGGLPYGGESGWELHAWWFHLPLWCFVAYLFYTAPRSLRLYWASLVLFIIMGLGSGFGGTLGFISTVACGYSIYKKRKENPSNATASKPTDTGS